MVSKKQPNGLRIFEQDSFEMKLKALENSTLKTLKRHI